MSPALIITGDGEGEGCPPTLGYQG